MHEYDESMPVTAAVTADTGWHHVVISDGISGDARPAQYASWVQSTTQQNVPNDVE
jgi:hypothetical protein